MNLNLLPQKSPLGTSDRVNGKIETLSEVTASSDSVSKKIEDSFKFGNNQEDLPVYKNNWTSEFL